MSIEDRLYKYLSLYKTMPDWVKQIISAPFRIFPRRFLLGKMYSVFYEEAKSMEFADKNQIAEYQLLKLQNLITHALRTVPLYQNLWGEYGTNISNIKSLEDFHCQIPLVTRDMLQATPEKFISSSFNPSDRLKMNSGGSTGIPITLYYLKNYSRAAEWAHMHLQWERVGFKVGKPMATLRGDYLGKDRFWSYDPWRNTLLLSSFALNKNNADMYLQLLREYRIEYINAYPASLYNLVQLSKTKDAALPSLKVIFLGSENIFDWQLKKFRDFFDIDKIFHWYGHGEQCALAGGCEVSSCYHCMPTYGYVELVDSVCVVCDNDNPDQSSEAKEIVGTSFVNPLMPLIRYRTQDYAIPADDQCECGRAHKRISKVIGREQEIAIGFNGEKITLTALIFGRHVIYFDHIVKMQIINSAPGKLVVKVIPKKSFSDEHSKLIRKTLSLEEGMPFEAEVHLVDSIPSTRGGKHLFFIREIPLE
jgi:phenylacetate-CoA ligase